MVTDDNSGEKVFKYRKQLTNIAHREQVDITIELDDVHEFDDELAISIASNTRRYVNLLLEVSLYLFFTYNCRYLYLIFNIKFEIKNETNITLHSLFKRCYLNLKRDLYPQKML